MKSRKFIVDIKKGLELSKPCSIFKDALPLLLFYIKNNINKQSKKEKTCGEKMNKIYIKSKFKFKQWKKVPSI